MIGRCYACGEPLHQRDVANVYDRKRRRFRVHRGECQHRAEVNFGPTIEGNER